MKNVNGLVKGQIVSHYCCGQIVKGIIIYINKVSNEFHTVHDEITSGKEKFVTSRIYFDKSMDKFIPKIVKI